MNDIFDKIKRKYSLDLLSDFQSQITKSGIIINAEPYLPKGIYLTEEYLNEFLNSGTLNINKLEYIEHCGFHLNKFTEIFFTVSNFVEWPSDRQLKIKIDGFFIEIGLATGFSKIFLMAKYFDVYSKLAIEELLSVKIYSANIEKAKDCFHKALYYLNSHYLYKSKNFGIVANFETEYPNYYAIGEQSVNRTRTRNRRDFISIEPLKLYNYAKTEENHYQYLAFYRVLEFFFPRVIEIKVKEMRSKNTISESAIISFIRDSTANEKNYLFHVIENSLTSSKKNNILSYSKSLNLIDKNASFRQFTDKIYEIRNSIVHSKENEITKSFIPEIFFARDNLTYWNYIIRDISHNAINTLNTKE
jgi:hypothetical protein